MKMQSNATETNKIRRTRRHGILSAVTVVLLLICVCFTLTACNENAGTFEDTPQSENSVLYLASVEESEGFYIAFVTCNSVSEPLAEIPSEKITWQERKNAFWNVSKMDISFSSDAVYDAVWEYVRSDGELSSVVTEDNLKIMFVYDTMDKSVNSNAEKIRIGNVYRHVMGVSRDVDETVFKATLDYPYSANWYAVLVGCAVLVFAVIGIGIAVAKGRLWQREKK